ncbi:MAG: leucine--tRNA ligase [Bacteroidales bacterium]|jgi:leucyl-tRNA synthetase|nr:leucine--tRNA ligase [Bacteroidales bacterium]
MEYNHREVEQKWQNRWRKEQIFKAKDNKDKPKYYVLDMFPYPSGAGLHVGHPLGYIASDIVARYKRQKGFNVLHPMGYDAYGLPAEQYAIQTGQHPAITTEQNINRYRQQLDLLGLSYDWSREVRTCDPSYYKWTQWTFIQLFNSFYCYDANKALPISELIPALEGGFAKDLNVACGKPMDFSAQQWADFSEQERSDVLMNYRLAYLSEAMVNWCADLGTVLANDEVVNGVSVRGGFPVERKSMKQWSLRITAYAERLLEGLERIEWSESLKEIQRNWIGKSKGATLFFELENGEKLEIFTTRADTLFGATFMVLCPEHPIIDSITTDDRKAAVKEYITWAKNRSERERLAEVKLVSGIFTGSYAINPLNGERLPVWVADYVLAGYGSGAIMAVPAHDSRDFAFARKFNLPVRQVVVPEGEQEEDTTQWQESKDSKEGTVINSGLITGLKVKDAIEKIINYIEEKGIGYGTTNYRLRDAIFSRQRYWGEPFPIYYENGVPKALSEEKLPLLLPDIETYLPTETGEPPLARAKDWNYNGNPYDHNTMPGFAGSNAYYLRYEDPHNDTALVSKETNDYWQNVDLYIGGSEHATGHLLYSRFITKFLFDIGKVCTDEPFVRLINQGMVQGRSNFVYRIKGTNRYVSFGLKNEYETDALHVDISLVENNDVLNLEKFKAWREEFNAAEFILEGDKYICGWEIEKMSKSLYNVQNPDMLVERYGADTLRLYEMFLGPLEQSKPWDTQGIEGVSRFIKKFWRLYHDRDNVFYVSDLPPSKEELAVLHRAIGKVEQDIEKFSFNTSVSTFMVCVNLLTDLKCNKRQILEPLAVLISSFAPHIAEEIWELLGHKETITYAQFPKFDNKYLEQTTFKYPVSINGKTRTFIELDLSLTQEGVETAVMKDSSVQKFLDNKPIKRFIFVPKRIINIVV